MTCPAYCCVAALYWFTNSMMFTPCWPRAVPTGGAGVAAPALICRVTTAMTFFLVFGAMSLLLLRFQRPGRASRRRVPIWAYRFAA